MSFLRLAEAAGWRTIFLGPAVPVEKLVEVATREHADLIGASYRLTPENAERLLGDFAEAADDLRTQGARFVFGGTPAVAERAESIGFFDLVFDGTEPEEVVLAYLKGRPVSSLEEEDIPQRTVPRIHWKAPYPLIRHHFGLPTMEATLAGVAEIAEARVLDVISLGTDQDAQANFFHPERQDARRRGAGGVPVRTRQDYAALHAASRRGNYPLMRSYAGTDDFLQLAELYAETIDIAWCAVPIFWFNQMDGRGPWDLEGSIREHQKLMAWHGERGIPVEVNEPHHWVLRDAPDVIFVVAAYLSAYNARAFGVRDYIAQLMFNTPPGVSDAMDLAKMLAALDIIASLTGSDFRIWRQTRTGLFSYPLDISAASAHLAASVYVQMALRPHILHVVAHVEAHHAAAAKDVIEACTMARRVVENVLRGAPDMTTDSAVQARKEELLREAEVTLGAIRALAEPSVPDAFLDPGTLAKAVASGVLDAPHLRNNAFARGEIKVRIDARGACIAVGPTTGRPPGRPLAEEDRLARLGIRLT
jgi:hypothetical protein